MKQDNRSIYLALLFVLFLALRLFSSVPTYLIGGDDAKYLALAQVFPNHTLDNDSYFLLHGPFYPSVLWFMSLFFEDYIGALLFSLIASMVTFIFLYKLVMLISNNFRLAFTTLILFTLSIENIAFAHTIHKEATMVMLITLSLYYFVHGLKKRTASFYLAAVFGMATALTTDHVVFLFPLFIIAYYIFAQTRTYKALIPFATTLITYLLYLSTRINVYLTNEYYSTGVDGVIERVADFGIRQIFNPVFFPETIELVFLKTSVIVNFALVFGFLFNLFPLVMPRFVTVDSLTTIFSTTPQALVFVAQFAFYLILFSLFLFGVYKTIKQVIVSKKIRGNYHLFMLFVFLAFIFPGTQRITSTRVVLMASLPIFYFIAYGLTSVTIPTMLSKRLFARIGLGGLVVLILGWVMLNPYFVLAQGNTPEAQNTAHLLANLPGQGVMSQVGYSPELNYQTDKRIITMPSSPENIAWQVREYNISYVLYGERYWAAPVEENKDVVFNYDSIKYVQDHPEQFRLIAEVPESYGSHGSDVIYVYEVI